MIYENHDFDKDSSYHDMLVAFHIQDLTKEFDALKQHVSSFNKEEAKEDGKE